MPATTNAPNATALVLIVLFIGSPLPAGNLQKAYEQRDAHLVHLEQDPAFDVLREDAAFKVIAIAMRLPEAGKLGS